MLQQTDRSLDALILEEKRRVAVEFFEDAWAQALQEGIEPSILADSALDAILQLLARVEGDSAVGALIEGLPEREASGDFLANRTLQ